MLTKRDKQIVRYIEDNGFITISQCCNIWFNDKKYGYDLARKRLQEIERLNYCKSYIDHKIYAPEKIYYIDDKYAKPSKHTIISMNIYSELIKLGATILYFKREQKWLNGKYRTDAFIVYLMDRSLYATASEIILGSATNKSYTDQREIMNGKYYEVFVVNEEEVNTIVDECLKKVGINESVSANKSVLFVDEIEHNKSWIVDEVRTFQVGHDLKGIGKILI